MKILADENIARPIVGRLRQEGYQVRYIFEFARGTADIDILVISDDNFMDGNPIVRGTRITVEQILLNLARGMSVKQILEEYPELTPKGVKAALKFAAESVRFDHVTPRRAPPRR